MAENPTTQHNDQGFPFADGPHQIISCMDNLSHCFSSLSLIPQSNQSVFGAPPILPPNPQGFIPASGYAWIDPLLPTPMPLTSHAGPFDLSLSGFGPYGAPPCFLETYGYHLPPTQVNVFLASVPQQLQQHPLLPSQLSVFGLARRGTGVFHPQVISNKTRRRKKRGKKKTKQEAEGNPQENIKSSKGKGKGEKA